jgi:ribosomal protein L37AE/L43A
MGFFSGGKYGLSPRGLYALRLAELIQLVIGLLVTLLAANAWRKPALPAQEPASPPPSPPVVHADPPARRSRAPRAGKPRLAESSAGVRVAESRRPAGRRRPKTAAGSRSRSRTASPKAARVEKSPVVRPARSRTRRRERRRGVQFASTEEHRCPYCLEIVQLHDPRGIVECKVCHTLHHADCWAITGTCQVPHLNS